jgi:hypothetical protein
VYRARRRDRRRLVALGPWFVIDRLLQKQVALGELGGEGIDIGAGTGTIDTEGIDERLYELLPRRTVGQSRPKHSPGVVHRQVPGCTEVEGDQFALNLAPFEFYATQSDGNSNPKGA